MGFDWSPALAEDLKSGLIDSLVVQDPFRMGYECVKSAAAAIEGRPLKKINNMDAKLVDHENLNTPDVQARINPDIKKYLE